MGAFVLLGPGFWWLVIALLFTLHYRASAWPSTGVVGLHLPLGVFALASQELQRQTDMVAFGGCGLLLLPAWRWSGSW